MRYWLVLFIIPFILIAGCSQPQPPVNVTEEPTIVIISTPEPTPISAPIIEETPIPEHTIPPVIITEPTPEETAEEGMIPEDTPSIPITETDPTTTNFTKFLNNTDFSMIYPESWIVSSGSFTTWSNRIWSGPEQFKPEGRFVRFMSVTGKTWFEVKVYDWISPGNHKLNQDMQIVRTEITEKCPDVSGDSAITNYKYLMNDYRYMIMSYDVKIPVTSNCSPMEYAEESFVSYSHLYKFDFVTIEGSVDTYRDMVNTMMDSVKPEPLDTLYSGQRV